NREQLDVATLHAQLRTLSSVWISSSIRAGRMTVESSCAQHCLTLRSAGQLQALEKDTYRALPNPRNQEVQPCIMRMPKWADMAKAVVEAEFPDILVVTAFSIFD
ncbi:MAG: hypothetical protein ACKPKO_56965, partial [Candidatus Fonsibacter sp.]